MSDDGLYLHRNHTPHLDIAGPDGTTTYVTAQTFMEMQKERDDYRRTLALINAATLDRWVEPAGSKIRRLLDRAGFTVADARAMQDLIDWARRGD